MERKNEIHYQSIFAKQFLYIANNSSYFVNRNQLKWIEKKIRKLQAEIFKKISSINSMF